MMIEPGLYGQKCFPSMDFQFCKYHIADQTGKNKYCSNTLH